MRSGVLSLSSGRSVLSWIVLALCLGTFVAANDQSAQPRATGLILGQVVDASGGAVSGAIVTITGTVTPSPSGPGAPGPGAAPVGTRRMLTNGDGRFLFAGLPKGTYAIGVTKYGYVGSGPGKLRPDGSAQPLELADGERNGSLKITLWKHAVISGRLTDDAGEPFVGATIRSLRRSYATGRLQMVDGPAALTDDRGFFRVASLVPGDYMICVVASQTTLPAALVDAHGRARLAGGSAVNDLLRPLSTNAIGFTVGTLTPGMRVGDLVVQTVGPYSRGMVPPGPDESGRLLSFQTTFYPSVVNMSQADVITLTSGEERSGADIRLRLVPMAPVAGTVVGPAGPVANVGVRLAPGYSPDLSNEQSFEAALTVTDASGRFTFMGVPTGQYILRALTVPQPAPLPMIDGVRDARGGPPLIPQEPTLWANVPVAIGAEGIRDVTVKLSGGFRVSGKIIFEGTAKPPAPATIQNSSVSIVPADGHQVGHFGALRGRIEPDGTFTTYEIPPGQYVVRYGGGQGWTLRSVMFQGRDVSSVPLDLQGDVSGLQIVMTDRPSELSGTVRDESGKADPTAAVLVFPSDRAEWTAFGDASRRLRILRANGAGGFRVTGLPAGQYLIAAIPDAEAGDWQNPATLEVLVRTAVHVAIADAEKKTQDVVTRRVR